MSKIKIIAFLILGFLVYKIFFAVKDFEVGLDKRIEKVEALGLGEEGDVIGLMMYLVDPEDLVLVEHLLVKNKSKCFDMKQNACLLYTSPSPRDRTRSRMPSSA